MDAQAADAYSLRNEEFMFGIFMESLVIFKLYTGLKLLFVLFMMSLIYLLITEKNKNIRSLFVYAPVMVILLFLFPLCRKAWVAFGLDGETYYRILWTIPMGIITAYGACRLWSRHKRIGLAATAVAVVLCGSLVYKSPYITKAENLYHLPDTVIKICDLIGPEDGVVTAVFPEELIHFVRQYNSDIRMPYGRDVIAWGYHNEVYDVFEKPEVIDVEKMLEMTRKHYCEYLIFPEGREMNQDPVKYGLVLLAEIDGYQIFADPVTKEVTENWNKYYE